jgi:hypothetical protein
MKKRTKKLNLTRETVSNLDPEKLGHVGGQALAQTQAQAPAGSLIGCCQESVFVCSVIHTCYSCNGGDTTIAA